jgi:periplasmic divalent cation tolerance protein
MKKDCIVVFVTCASAKEARALVYSLLKKKLVACGNITANVKSYFRWKGRIERSSEAFVMLKARRRRFGDIEKEIKRMHSYDIPEIIALPIAAGSDEYIKWVKENCK